MIDTEGSGGGKSALSLVKRKRGGRASPHKGPLRSDRFVKGSVRGGKKVGEEKPLGKKWKENKRGKKRRLPSLGAAERKKGGMTVLDGRRRKN